jgi:sigma-B regulation protein RsbU (phosphoserine phosphatase)
MAATRSAPAGRRHRAAAAAAWGRHPLTWAAAWLWLLGAVLADAVTGRQDIVLVVLFAVAPLIASAALAWPAVAGLAGVAIGLAAASPAWNVGTNTVQQVVRAVDVAIISLAAVSIAAVRERRERRLSAVSAVATAAQHAVLPSLPEQLGPLRLACSYRSATEEAMVGGDLYDAIEVGDRVRVIVGDVRGKGLDAVSQASRAIRAFRQYAGSEPSLPAVAAAMSAHLAPFFAGEEFVTAALAETDGDGRLAVVLCGHPPPAVATAGAEVRWLPEADGPPLGIAERLGLDCGYRAHTVAWAPGDRVLLYTDGLSEARDASGRFLPRERVTAALGSADPEQVVKELLEAVDAYIPDGGHHDDLALVVLQYDPAPE